MAASLPGLTPAEVAFLCEMELVTVIPRQRLEGLELLGGTTAALNPPHRTPLPLWLALLLKRQDRANILPPPWLSMASLDAILQFENSMPTFSPAPTFNQSASLPHPSAPFLPSATEGAAWEALPYHWLELSHLLLEEAGDDIVDADGVRRLLRDLRETRAAKLRKGIEVLEGGREVVLNGVGGLEVAENRAFVAGVMDGLRKIGASKEGSRREKEAEERENGVGYDEDDEDEDML